MRLGCPARLLNKPAIMDDSFARPLTCVNEATGLNASQDLVVWTPAQNRAQSGYWPSITGE